MALDDLGEVVVEAGLELATSELIGSQEAEEDKRRTKEQGAGHKLWPRPVRLFAAGGILFAVLVAVR